MNPAKKFKVDFFCIGAAKSGSTWLAQCLSEHPQITISRRKETNFFARKLSSFGNSTNPKYMQDWEWYRSQFDHQKPGNILGDFSINLMHNTLDAAQNIKEAFPDAKFIAILRDPVKRVYSNFWHEKRYDLKEGMPENFEEALNNNEMLFRSKYCEQLSMWLSLFPLERFFIITDIELKQDVKKVIFKLFEFLNVAPEYQPLSLEKKINEARSANRIILLGRKVVDWMFRNKLGRLAEYIYRLKINKIIFSLNTSKTSYPPMGPETEKMLRQYYAQDINNLEKLIGKDLGEWKDCSAER